MKKVFLLAVVILSYPMPARADRVYVGKMPWSQANVSALHGADLATVVKFVNSTQPADALDQIRPNQMVDFAWLRVGGGGSDLIVALDIARRGFYTLWIYSHGGGDNLIIQQIRGWGGMGGLKAMIHDLNGDGVDELIVPAAVGQEGAWTPTASEPLWPAIYRPVNGKYIEKMRDFPNTSRTKSIEVSTRYVEASRDFSNYYDTKFLPVLDQTIAMLRQKAAQGDGNPGALARFTIVKDKILRVLGRDPTAGLNQAYQWMNSDDPEVLQCALATFYDIGGHEKEVSTLKKEIPGAIARSIEARKGE